MGVIVRHGGNLAEAGALCHHAAREGKMAGSRGLLKLADRIDRFNTGVGRAVAWLALAIVLGQFALVVARYVLGFGSIWLTEAVLYAHATLFLLAAAWTLKMGGHVRVDIFYADASARARAVVDFLGALLLLLPFMLLLLLFAVPYAARSWSILERSQEVGGLPLVFLLKTLMPLCALLLALQGVAQAIRAAPLLIYPSEEG
jgi:TRAP-type mannitol/chloroaromatic compound transport system permease small subunit